MYLRVIPCILEANQELLLRISIGKFSVCGVWQADMASIKGGAEDGCNDNQLRKLHDKTNSFDELVMATVLPDNL